MNERVKYYAFVFLILRALLDFTLTAIIYYQVGNLVPSIGLMLVCCVFYFFLYAGIRNEEFYGRDGRRVILGRESVAYWFVVAVLVLCHLIITTLMIRLIHW